MEMTAFSHIPRTGGNYVVSALYAAVAASDETLLFGLPYPFTREMIESVLQNGDYKYIFHGHGAADLSLLFPKLDIKFFTFLRDPVIRTLSEFLWLIRRVPSSRNDIPKLHDLARRWIGEMNEVNHQVRYLARPLGERVMNEMAHLTMFDHLNGPIEEDYERAFKAAKDMFFVGRTEDLSIHLPALLRRLRLRLAPGSFTNSHVFPDLFETLRNDLDLIDELKAKSLWDAKLYDECRR